MQYEFHLIWKDGYEENFRVYSAEERDSNLADMFRRRNEYSLIEYRKAYAKKKFGKYHRML